MATIYGSVTNYTADDYLVDQGDYVISVKPVLFTGSASGTTQAITTGSATSNIALTSSASGGLVAYGTGSSDIQLTGSANAVTPKIIYAGSTTWEDCGTWETWPFNEWNGGVGSDIALTSSSAGSFRRFGTGTSNIAVSADILGGFLLTVSGSSDLSITTSGSANIQKTGSGTATLSITSTAAGIDQDRASGSANIVLSTSASSVITLDGVGSAGVELTASGSAIQIHRESVGSTITLTCRAIGSTIRGSDPRRTYTVDSETREFLVLPDTRVTIVPSETRVLKIYEEKA